MFVIIVIIRFYYYEIKNESNFINISLLKIEVITIESKREQIIISIIVINNNIRCLYHSFGLFIPSIS